MWYYAYKISCWQSLQNNNIYVCLTFLFRSWLGSEGANSPTSRGFRNFFTKVKSGWKAVNASWKNRIENIQLILKVHCNQWMILKDSTYWGVLSSVVANDSIPSWMSFGPLCGVVNLSIYNQPLVIPAAVSLHLLPGVDTSCQPAASVSWLRQPASSSVTSSA